MSKNQNRFTKFCVVIPIYNEQPDIIEQFSLNRLNKVIGNKYDVFYINRKGFDTKPYQDILKANVIEYDPKFFESPQSYSQLLISHDFYLDFKDYDYMLIYQTDCYIFIDQINLWCDMGYDYVGAPIIAKNPDWSLAVKGIPQVGNGGLSLRKIQTFLDLTNPKGEFMTYYNITEEQLKEVKFEDVWFCDFVWRKYEYNIAPWKIAARFALDMNVKNWYNDLKIDFLPMACHAWPKNIRDWKDKFEEMNDDIVNYCEEKYKDLFKVYYDGIIPNKK